jgi:hypothetical protein
MTSFPDSPRLLKGALVGLDLANLLASLVVFQYNPDSMTRKLDIRSSSGAEGADKSEALRLTGPPKETITISIEVDATDGLEENNPLATALGIYPALSALELLLYPKIETVTANAIAAQAGMIEIVPPAAPLTLFVWGPARVLPVRPTSLSITEEAFDILLNPIRAKVDLSMQVLSYYDLKITNPGYTIFKVHQITKEVLATTNALNNIQNIGVSLKL